jgi:hypothetical protein
LPTKLEKQVDLFRRSAPEVAVICCPRGWIDAEGRPIDLPQREQRRGDVLAAMFRRPFVCFSSSMVRRSVLEEVGMFDESIPMAIDYDLWLRIALKYHFDFVDEPLILYRTGHGNLSRRKVERSACVRTIIHRFLDDLGGRARVSPVVVREVWAEHCCDTAAAWGWTSRGWPRALTWYLRALSYEPFCSSSWKGIATGWWPHSIKALFHSPRTSG